MKHSTLRILIFSNYITKSKKLKKFVSNNLIQVFSHRCESELKHAGFGRWSDSEINLYFTMKV